ncbi:MAG TPA: flagellin lysine-N-methylase [Chloroflexota bacterium]|nr:flagellin lysine-N-methylase [Chloroflexota bacterium]
MSEPPVRAPRYLSRFRCIGPACEDHCCAGWGGIDVDPPTAEAYRQLTVEGDQRAWLLNLVNQLQPNPEAWPDEGWPAALIPLPTAMPCPFFGDDHLCTIQGALGEELLPSTCDTFPRQATQIDGQIDLAGRLSCPEVARLALLAEDALAVETVPADRRLSERGRFWVDRPWSDEPEEDDPRRQYHLVRARSMALLQQRAYPLAVRMLALGLALSSLACPDEGGGAGFRAADAESTFDLAEQRLPSVSDWVEESGLGAGDGLGGPHRLLLRRIRRWIAMTELPARYRRCVERVRLGLGLPADATTPLDGPLGERVGIAYTRARQRHLDPYLVHRPYLFEHLALNQIWLGTFPYHPERTFAEEHALLTFRIGLMRLHLVGAAAAEGGLTDDLVVETVQAFDKYVDGHQFWDRTMKLLRDEQALDPPSLAALLLA